MRKSIILILIIVSSSLIPNTFGNGHSESDNIFYSTFFGGSEPDRIRDVCLDSQGNIIVVGGTFSEDFPIRNAVQNTYGGGEMTSTDYFPISGDAFVAKFSPDYELLWSTYLGGTGYEDARHVLAGGEGEVIVVGVSTSTDFPVTMGSGPSGSESGEAFIAMYTPDGELIGVRLYVPDEIDIISDLMMDSSGNMVMVGTTNSQSMYTTEDAIQHQLSGENDGFVRIVSYDLESIVYSTYLGGSGIEYFGGLAIGQDGSIYIIGGTSSRDFPVTMNCIRSEFNGEENDNVIVKIDSNKNLAVSTYFGGTGIDNLFGLCEGSDNSMVFVGRSWSSDYPITSDALQPEYSEVEVDGVFTVLNGNGDEILYSTYYGKSGWDSLLQVNKDENSKLIISGFVDTEGFETVNAFQSQYLGSTELVVMVLGEEFELISYLGGYYYEHPFAQIVQDGALYLVGQTSSPGFMVTEDAFQSTLGGGEEGFLWVMNYEEYLSVDHSTEDGSAGFSWYDYRDYLSYGVVIGVIVVWYLYMRRAFSGEG